MKREIIEHCLRIAGQKHGPSHPSWNAKACHYTFIIQNNQIVEMGLNRPNCQPPAHYGYHENASIHAEIDAWRKARGILDGSEWEILNIKITKEHPVSRFTDAAPCPTCEAIMRKLGCKRFYFTTSSGKIARIIN